MVLWYDEAHPRMYQRGSDDANLEVLGPQSLPLRAHVPQLGSVREPMAAGKRLRLRRLRTWKAAER